MYFICRMNPWGEKNWFATVAKPAVVKYIDFILFIKVYNLKVYVFFSVCCIFSKQVFVVCFWSINKNVMFTSVVEIVFYIFGANNWIQISKVLIINPSHKHNYIKHNAQVIIITNRVNTVRRTWSHKLDYIATFEFKYLYT